MSTHNIQFHDKISLNSCFLELSKNFIGTQKWVHICHGKRVISVPAIEVRLYKAVTIWVDDSQAWLFEDEANLAPPGLKSIAKAVTHHYLSTCICSPFNPILVWDSQQDNWQTEQTHIRCLKMCGIWSVMRCLIRVSTVCKYR